MPAVKLTLKADFKGAADEMNRALNSADKGVKKLTDSLKKFDTTRLEKFAAKAKLMGLSVRATRGPLQGAIAQQRMLSREIEKSIRSGLDPMSKSLTKLRGQYSAVSGRVNRLTQAKRALTQRTKDLERATRRQTRAMKDATDTAAYYARYGLMAVVAAGVLLAGSMLKAASGIENAAAAFRPMLGSLMKANALVGLINETAAKTPFQFEAIATSVKQLLPAVKGNMLGVIKTFRMLGDVSSGNAQRLDSVTRAYTKSMLRGQVDMRSLNMIARAGVPIFSELSETMGVTVKELFKLSRAGEISSTDLTAAFQRMTSKGGMFFEGMKIASLTLSGRISTLKDNIMLLGVNLGNVLLPAAKAFVETALEIVGYLREITQNSLTARIAVDLLAASFLLAGGGLTYLILVAKGAAIIEALTLAFWGLNAAMYANPFGMVVAGLAAITVAAAVIVRNWTFLGVKMASTLDLVQLKADIFVAEMKRDFAIFSIELGAAFEHGLLHAATRAFMAISNQIASLARMAEGYLPGAGAMADYAEGLAESFKKNFPVGTMAAKEIKVLETVYGGVIGRLNKKSETFQKKIHRRLKDAKLVLEAVAGGGVAPGKEGPSLSERVLNVPGDKLLREQHAQMEAIKKGLKERMDLHRIAKDKRIKFLLDEKARIRSIMFDDSKEQARAVQATEDLIAEIMAKGSKKRVARAKKANADIYKELLRVSVNDVQQRRHKMERGALKSHFEERIKIMQVAKEDEVAFLEREGERLQKFTKLNADQRVRAEKMASDMILAIHTRNFGEMTKVAEDAALKADKLYVERFEENVKRINAVEDKALKAQISMSKSTIAAMQSFVNHTTDFMVNAAKTGKYAFKDMVSSIANDIFRLMANKIIANFFLGLFSGRAEGGDQAGWAISGGGSFDMGSSGLPQISAMGNFATRPTFSIYGEKGPEAILPLVRRNGVLGVGAPVGGGSGRGTTINIINNAGVEIEEQRTSGGFGGEEVTTLIISAVKKGFDNGDFEGKMKDFGVSRRGMGRG